MSSKAEARLQAKRRLHLLSPQRRAQAAERLATLAETLPKGPILSFHSFGEEIDTSLLNAILMAKGELVLPNLRSPSKLYRVFSLEELKIAASGRGEPDPKRCEEIAPERVQRALIPALAFDEAFYRLGYGHGYYDRLLPSLRGPAYGIGFLEQRVAHLPTESHDIPLSGLLLF